MASPTLISMGLAVIFGMMRVINLAHGEFLMLGGYAAIAAYNAGMNIWPAMLGVAPVVVGVFGVLTERAPHPAARTAAWWTRCWRRWGLSLALIGSRHGDVRATP